MTRIYRVASTRNADAGYYRFRQEAYTEAQERANDASDTVEVELCHLVDNLSPTDLACALLSGSGWCRESRIVRFAKPKKEQP